jgi:hypothetical protein
MRQRERGTPNGIKLNGALAVVVYGTAGYKISHGGGAVHLACYYFCGQGETAQLCRAAHLIHNPASSLTLTGYEEKLADADAPVRQTKPVEGDIPRELGP